MKKFLFTALIAAGFATISMSFTSSNTLTSENKVEARSNPFGEVQGWVVITTSGQSIIFAELDCAQEYVDNNGGMLAGVGYALPQNLWACY